MTEQQKGPRPAPQFHAFAADFYARKLELGKIRSSAGKAKWETVLARHLVPAFGELFIDRIEPADVEAWRAKVSAKIDAGEIAPATANTMLGVLHQITDEAIDEFDIRDPMQGIEPFETNEQLGDCDGLSRDDVRRFMKCLKELDPRAYDLHPFRADYEAAEAEETEHPRPPRDA